ncbi:MAG TPA: flagellar basal-body MS-ring/collar protein FliF [Opitutaceae bacterium]|nr:flagellar basal-body MS-ring/collar protein FliF [Opitutaceae bacterium]
MKNFGSSLLALWKQLGLNQRVSLVVAAIAVAGGMIALVCWSRRPDFQLLYGHLGDKDAAAIISYLESQNIPHEVTAGGTAVEVPSDQVYKLRMDLAGKGLPGGDGVGFEIFDKGQFGLSDFIQRTNYIRAVQGELARTITQLQGVRAARVMIVQPENRLLITEQTLKATASVFVDLGGGRLDPDQVNAIRHLVANAVQGLQVDDVAVVDNHGRVLSEDLKQDPTLSTASSQMRYKQQVEDYLAQKVQSMLATVIGAGNAVVRVSADIDSDASTTTQEIFDPNGQVTRTETTTDNKSNSSESRGGGAVGVTANVPDKGGAPDGAARPTTLTNSDVTNHSVTYEINRTLTNTVHAAGAIRSITAAVIIAPRTGPGADKRTPEELESLRQIVINALGLKAQPGQSLDSLVTLEEEPFAAEPVAQEVQTMVAQNRWSGLLEAGSRWAAVLGAAAILLVFLRMLSRQKPEPVPVELLTLPPEVAMRAMPNGNRVTPDMVNELIRAKPANVGVALRGWIAETKN